MKPILSAAALVPLFAFAAAHAEVRQAAADSFFLAYSEPVSAPPAKTYAAVTAVAAWWNGEHTWSGQASNLSLKAEAGGCFCERWAGGSAEHGRVVMAMPAHLLRIETALGPLQELALEGVLSFWIRAEDDGSSRLDVEYRVNGASASGLDALAPQVDEILGMQVARLARYADTGRPDEPAAPATATATESETKASPEAIRAALLEQWKREAEAARAAAAPVKPEAKPAARDPAPKPG